MELVSIQYLRAAAALSVVVYHVEVQLKRMGIDGPWPTWLGAGVDVFFVISGFLMVMTTHGKQMTPKDFYTRRIVRIVPLYWILTIFMLAIQFLSPSSLQNAKPEMAHILSSFLFIPWMHPVIGEMFPVVVPGWTLNYEMFFYLLFGATLLMNEHHRVKTIVLLLVALSAVGFIVPEQRSILGFYTHDVVLDFGLGVLIAYFFSKGIRLSTAQSWISLTLGAAGIAFFHWDGAPRALAVGVPAAMIVIGAIGVETSNGVKRLWLPHFLGDASYSIYLSHGIVLSALGQGWRKFGLVGAGSLSFTLVAVAVACIAGGLLYVLVEKPIQRLFRPRKKPTNAIADQFAQ